MSIQYNLCNEPWLKYTLSAIADRGLKRTHWTSSRLLDEVLLLETASVRYQIARVGEATEGGTPKVGNELSPTLLLHYCECIPCPSSGSVHALQVQDRAAHAGDAQNGPAVAG